MPVDLTLLTAYTATAALLLVIPGPTIMTVVAYGLSQGPRAAWASTLGVVVGDAVAVIASLTGLGAVMALSPSLFHMIKWAGAAYLLWLAAQTWRESNRVTTLSGPRAVSPVPLVQIFRQNFIVTALNPKGIVFFVAFIPQFVHADLAYWPQVVVYGVIFVTLGGANALAYAYSAGRLSAFFTRPGPLRWMKRVGAAFLASAGVYTLFAQLS